MKITAHPLEHIPHGEERAIQAMIDLLKEKITREKPSSGEIERDAHPKQHGLVRAKFSVRDDIPETLKHGVFKEPHTYDCWLRFSNQNAPPLPDKDKDIRGLAIKLLGVEGPKLLQGNEQVTTHDFITISTDAFVTKDAEEFNDLLQNLVKGKLAMAFFLALHWRVAKNLLRANRQFTSPLDIQYFSSTPYLLGDEAVKYSVKPVNISDKSIPDNASYSYLKEVMEKQLEERGTAFDFMVQRRTSHKSMPVEDPGKVWPESKAPFVPVARIEIPQQTFSSDAQHRYGIEMSFNPWRCLAEHRPLGGINRARRLVYDEISKFRHRENGTQLEEPTEMKTFS